MTSHGWDASHYDWDRGPVEPARAEAEGIVFMTHKLSEGMTYVDPRYDDFWKKVKVTNLIPGAYHVLRRGNPVGQADVYLARLDAMSPGWRNLEAFIIQADCERWQNGAIPEPTPTDIRSFCDRVASRAPGHVPLVYAPEWLYGNALNGLPYPLWESAYGSNTAGGWASVYPGDSSVRWNAYSGQVPAILQYGSKLRIGGQGGCDANAFRGTRSQFIDLIRGDDMALSDDDKNWIADALVSAIAGSGALVEDPRSTSTPKAKKSIATYVRYQRVEMDAALGSPNALPATNAKIDALADALLAARNAIADVPHLSADAFMERLGTGDVVAIEEVLRAGMSPADRLALASRLAV